MLANSAGDDTLVVFDKYQGCPPLSKLPTSYEAQVAELSGVAETTPTLFLLSACSRATDLVAVHGIEPEKFRRFRKIDMPEEQYRAFSQERGAAIVGEKVARTYGWRIGQAVTLQKLGDISFTVRGIFRAPGSSLENAILVGLDYLQFATNQTGKMTLLLVKVSDPAGAGAVAERVDALFSSSASPTKTTPERSFIASAISGVTGIVEFSRWLGYVALGIRDRTREFAILKTLGFRRPQVLRLVIFEAGAGLPLRRSAGRRTRVAGGEPVESLALRRGIHDSAARHAGACFMGGRLGRYSGNGSGSSSSN